MVDSPHDPLNDPLIGQTLDGRLRVLRRIGEGGMGTVYVAEHVGLGKQVAVKVLNAQYAEHAEVVARLHSEARHAAAIHNEHIVDVFDIGATPGGRPYVVMELLHGESLAERLRQTRVLSEADTLRIGRQLASALASAHKSGIVHRDIKPENIFLCPREGGDFVKVLDFGISKALSFPTDGDGEANLDETPPQQLPATDPRLTRTGAILGTPLYMAPEQVRGEALDHRVDVYATGIVLYECLTGSVPFLAPSYLAVIAKILTESPEPPSLRSPERSLPAALEQIVLRAMAHDRDLRYPSMDLLVEDLERYRTGRDLQDATWQQPSGELDVQRMPSQKAQERILARAALGGTALPVAAILIVSAVVLGVGLMLTLWRTPAVPAAALRERSAGIAPATTAAPSLRPAATPVGPATPAVASQVPAQTPTQTPTQTPAQTSDQIPAQIPAQILAQTPTQIPSQAPSQTPAPASPANPAGIAPTSRTPTVKPPVRSPSRPLSRPGDPAPPQPLLEEQAPNPFLPAPGSAQSPTQVH